MSVCEAARNVVITGARPLGITDCLNFGDPERPEAFWQLSEAVRGIAEAARALDLPVVSGNVSLYNESPIGAILPTPQIGVVGLLDDIDRRVGPAFAADAHIVALAGESTPGLAGSAYAALAGTRPRGRSSAARPGARGGASALRAGSDGRRGSCRRRRMSARGGLAVALAEMCDVGRARRRVCSSTSVPRRRSSCSARARRASW